ncbi:hypothetical protein F5X98DRAFT_355983 [Xylaria grammica]|nr:hypothetical protein F5X98DRAFT_355983 [Xylaria grammica]
MIRPYSSWIAELIASLTTVVLWASGFLDRALISPMGRRRGESKQKGTTYQAYQAYCTVALGAISGERVLSAHQSRRR